MSKERRTYRKIAIERARRASTAQELQMLGGKAHVICELSDYPDLQWASAFRNKDKQGHTVELDTEDTIRVSYKAQSYQSCNEAYRLVEALVDQTTEDLSGTLTKDTRHPQDKRIDDFFEGLFPKK